MSEEYPYLPVGIDPDALVEKAVAALTTYDLERLEQMAETWIAVFELDRVGRGPDDLLEEAIVRTLDGRRVWRPDVPLVHHLRQAMRSIASSWRKSAAVRARTGAQAVRSADLAPAGHSRDFPDALDQMPADGPDVERRLVAGERLAAFLRSFADDREAMAVIHGWYDGLKGPEIRRRADLTEWDFQAAVRRIRRFAQRGEIDHVH